MKEPKILSYQLRVHKDLEVPCKGFIAEIDNTLKAKQDFVGGTIQCVRLTDEIDLICNDDGKLIGLPTNRVWFYEGKIVDIIVGDVLCVRHKDDEFTSIHESDIPTILECLRAGVYLGAGIFIPIDEDELPDYEGRC